jgi:hypothetical protein
VPIFVSRIKERTQTEGFGQEGTEKNKDVTGGWKNCIIRSFVTFHSLSSMIGWMGHVARIKENRYA